MQNAILDGCFPRVEKEHYAFHQRPNGTIECALVLAFSKKHKQHDAELKFYAKIYLTSAPHSLKVIPRVVLARARWQASLLLNSFPVP